MRLDRTRLNLRIAVIILLFGILFSNHPAWGQGKNTQASDLLNEPLDYFTGPSSGNVFIYQNYNIGNEVIHSLQVEDLSVIFDPAGILVRPNITLRNNPPIDLNPRETDELTIENLDFGNVSTWQECRDYFPPLIHLSYTSPDFILPEDYVIALPVIPMGFAQMDTSGCSVVNTLKFCMCQMWGCTVVDSSYLHKCPGDPFKPDDNVIVSSDVPEEFTNFDAQAPVGVLMGYMQNYTLAFLDSLGVKVRQVNPWQDLGARLAGQVKVLVVPSDGFGMLKELGSFKSRLAEYISAGGVVLVFSQAEGDSWGVLPGIFTGYGYGQDISCFSRGTVPGRYHPVISSEDAGYSDVHTDGFFTTTPADSEAVLIRVKDSSPALVDYAYGAGHVLATHMYPDYAYWTGQMNLDEWNYLRDMITWALRPAELPKFRPGETSAQLTLTLNYPAGISSPEI